MPPGDVWVCTGTIDGGVTPVAWVGSQDASSIPGVTCTRLPLKDVLRGARYGLRLGELLEELLAGL